MHRRIHAEGIALAGIQRGVVAGYAGGVQVVGHQVDLIHKRGDRAGFNVAQVRRGRAHGNAQHAGLAIRVGKAVEALAQGLEQQGEVAAVIGA